MKRLMVLILAVTLSGFATYALAADWLYVPSARVYVDLDSMVPLVDRANYVEGMRFWVLGEPNSIRCEVDCRTRTLSVLQVGGRVTNVAHQDGLAFAPGTKGKAIVEFWCEVAAKMNQGRQ